MTVSSLVIAAIMVFVGWGLVELVIEFYREPPAKGVTYGSSPIFEIIARSMNENAYQKSRPRTRAYPLPEEEEEIIDEDTDLVRL